MNNKYYLATVLLALGAFSPLYGVQKKPQNTNTPSYTPEINRKKKTTTNKK